MLKKIVLIIFITVAGFFLYQKYRPLRVDQSQPSPGVNATPVEKTEVSALGKISPKGGIIKIAAPHEVGPSIIKKLYIKEGDRVEADSLIATLNSYDRLQATVQEAEQELHTAKVRLELAKTNLESPDIAAQRAIIKKLGIELEYVEKEFVRMENLRHDNLVPTSDFEQCAVNYQVKKQELRAAQNQLENMRTARKQDVQMREAEVAEAESTWQRTKEELALATVESPITGTVLEVFAHEGEVVNQTDGIADLGNTDQMYVSAEVYWTDIMLIKPGQKVVINVDQIDMTLSGEVEEVGRYVHQNTIISADPAVDADARVVEVKIRLSDSLPVAGLTNLQVTCRIQL